MSTIPTQNPVPSEASKDLKFNSGKIDEFVTSSNHSYIDRFGKSHYTIEGINNLSKQAMQNYGYITKRSFESGNTIINPNDVLLWENNGEYYRWDGEIPKVVSAGSTPDSAGGIGDGKWKSIGDNSLRTELKEGNGSLIGVGNGITLDTKLSSMLSAVDYGFIGDIEGDSTPIFSKMQRDAMDAGIRVIHFPKETSFNLESTVLTNSNTILVGNANIHTSNPHNRYIKCYRSLNSPQDINYVTIGDVSSFSNVALRYKYTGNKKPKVVFIGDSLTMGRQHRFDFSGVSERLKTSISLGAGVECDFYNRAISGSSIAEFLGKIPVYANPDEVHGAGEKPWITDKERTWLSYINDIQPDLVVIAFGMNSPNANDTQFCLKVRAAIKGLASKPSIIWLTTPMRTIDASKSYNGVDFGKYPDNEYSNASGLSYGLYGKFVGDSVIDVNRSSSIIMLGIDPSSCSLIPVSAKRHRTSGDASVSISGEYINATLSAGAILSSTDYSRDASVEFIIDELFGVMRLRARNDPKSVNCIYVDISKTSVKLYAPQSTSSEMGLIKNVDIEDATGKAFRFQFTGTRVFITMDNALIIDVYDIYGSQFQNNTVIQAVNDKCTIRNVKFFNASYRSNPPLLTTDEIFSPSINYGFGGNGLNHLNAVGVEYVYGTAMKNFADSLKSAIKNNSSVKVEQGTPLLSGLNGSITARRLGNNIYIEGRNIEGSINKNLSIAQLDIMFQPNEVISDVAVGLSASSDNSFIGVKIDNNGRISFTKDIANNGVSYSFSVNYSRNN